MLEGRLQWFGAPGWCCSVGMEGDTGRGPDELRALAILAVDVQWLQPGTVWAVTNIPVARDCTIKYTSPHLHQRENVGMGNREISRLSLLIFHLWTPKLRLLPCLPILVTDRSITRKELMSTQLYFPWKRDTKQAQSRAVITLQVFRGFIGNY